MPSALAKSGPSGITIMKSRMLTNWIAPTRKTSSRSDTPPAGVAAGDTSVSALPRAFAQGAKFLERPAAQKRIRLQLLPDGRRRRLAVVVPGIDARLLRQARQPLQAAPHLGRIAAAEVGPPAATDEQQVAGD